MKARIFVPLSVVAAMLATVAPAQTPSAPGQAISQAAAPMTHLAVGTVKRIDANQRTVMIDHQAIASMGMPAMTMEFLLREAVAPASLTVGQSIAFNFTLTSDGPVITSVQPIASQAKSGPGGRTAGHAMPGMQGHDMAQMQGMNTIDMEACREMMERK